MLTVKVILSMTFLYTTVRLVSLHAQSARSKIFLINMNISSYYPVYHSSGTDKRCIFWGISANVNNQQTVNVAKT